MTNGALFPPSEYSFLLYEPNPVPHARIFYGCAIRDDDGWSFFADVAL